MMEPGAAAADEVTAGRPTPPVVVLESQQNVPGLPGTLVEVRNLRKQYGRLVLFESINFQVKKQQMLAIVGQSGAGKSTLLHILGALDTASAGEVYFESTLLRSLSPQGGCGLSHVADRGYVWQFHYLLPEFTAAENVATPPSEREVRRKKRHCRKPFTGSAG